MKKIPTKYNTKFKYLPKKNDIILKNGKKISKIFSSFEISPLLRDLDGIPTEVAVIRSTDTAYRYIILGYTGDLVRNTDGTPMRFFGSVSQSISSILAKTDVMAVKRESDKKKNILSPDGTFLLKEWYDDIISIPQSNLFIVSDNDKFNLAKLGGKTLSETWYSGMEILSNKCFLCMDRDTKKYVMNDKGELMFDGEAFDILTTLKVSTSIDYLGENKFTGKLVCCVDTTNDTNTVKFITENLEVIDFGRPISEVNRLSSGVYKVVDNNDNCNVIGAGFKLISENWFTDIKMDSDVSFAYLNDRDFIVFGSKSLILLDNGTVFIGKSIEKSDPVKGLFLCVKRKDGKCNIYATPDFSAPVEKNWVDDIYKADDGFVVARDGESYNIVLCYHGSGSTKSFTIDGKRIFNLSPNKYCVQKSDGKFTFCFYEWSSGYSDMYGNNRVFDNVYDINSEYPIVEKDGKFNVFSVLRMQLIFDEWLDDVEPVDDYGYIRFLVDGEWSKINTKAK